MLFSKLLTIFFMIGMVNLYGIGDAPKKLLKNKATVASELNAPGLTLFRTFTGKYNVSTDGFGSTSQSGTISAKIPKNSIIIAAYLYSAGYGFGDSTGANINLEGLKFRGSVVTFDKYYVNEWTGGAFKTARADVTKQVQESYTQLAEDDIYNFNIVESDSSVDGEALVVIYQNNTLPTSTVAIIEGGANINGDEFVMNFDSPLKPSDDNFTLEMRMGISFSYPPQSSTIKVNGKTISDNAGNYDDGEGANGGLITVGGFDDPYSPNMPSYDEDKERYNLANYVTDGDTEVKVETINPSQDDNLFLIVFNSSQKAEIDVPCDLNAAYNDGYKAGKEYCTDYPEKCGISSGVVVIPL